MKKFFDYINPFQEEEDKPGKEERPVPVMTPTVLPAGSNDPKVIQYFEELMTKANLPGPDYHEFKKAMKGMSNVPEEMAIKTTFVAFSTMGIDKQKLVNSIDQYVEIIRKDTEGFQATVDKKIETEVTSRDNKVLANQTRITELNKQITDLQAESAKLSHEAIDQMSAINATRDAYIRTSESLIREMESDKTKINQYL